jgi:hypothetical protein
VVHRRIIPGRLERRNLATTAARSLAGLGSGDTDIWTAWRVLAVVSDELPGADDARD